MPSDSADGRPRVALLVTTYFSGSHADVLATRLMEGYPWEGGHTEPRVRVVSMYLEQLGEKLGDRDDYHPGWPGWPRADIGMDIAQRNGVEVFETVAEALGCGRPGLGVDGVVIIAEHGDYEFNEFGQQLYPRRRLFDSAMSVMIAAGQFVPVFMDKHLAWSYVDAQTMYSNARRLGFPILAGSNLPLSYREPVGAEWPAGAVMTGAVQVGHGSRDRYGIHMLEALQAATERRFGGEIGVQAVRGLTGKDATDALHDGTVDRRLLQLALGAAGATSHGSDQGEPAVEVKDVYLVRYSDGLCAAAVNFGRSVGNLSVALTGPTGDVAYRSFGTPRPFAHHIFTVRQVESLMLSRAEPYPVERTLLTTGMMDALMHSFHEGGEWIETPELGIAYEPKYAIPDTGVNVAIV